MTAHKCKGFKERHPHLLFMLIALTFLVIATEVTLFLVHYKVSDLIDSLINSSISTKIFSHIILFPVIFFVFIQFLAYALFIIWIWFITISQQEMFNLRRDTTYLLGLLFWGMGTLDILLLNNLYFPKSFFTGAFSQMILFSYLRNVVLFLTLPVLLMATFYAFINFFYHKRHLFIGHLFLVLIFIVSMVALSDRFFFLKKSAYLGTKPNIILIGLDSLRPDFTSFEAQREIKTPYIDHFLQSSVFFRQAYTPLARTFPAWMSILTGRHPKHHHARNNLQDPELVLSHETLAKRLQEEGYETIYATDEKRFSNITNSYGFDRIIGPSMGVNDFILGGLTDFPLTNLLVNLPIGRFLFPFNYGNRAAAITYEPDNFLHLIERDLKRTHNKPIFLAIHLCLSHWPFTWAHAEKNNASLAEQYEESVKGVDLQFGKLMQILNRAGLLEHAYGVLLSDHGTTVGLPGDRLITKQTYQGDRQKLKWISVSKLSGPPKEHFNKDFTIDTSYGQGTDILSLKQYRVLLAFKYFGGPFPVKKVNAIASLLDITPTLLEFLHLRPLNETDGISLLSYFYNDLTETPRLIFMETGDSLAEIQTDHIYIEKVIKSEISIYHVDREGLLFMDPIATQALIKNKQLGILWGDWLLVRYPAQLQTKLVPSEEDASRMHFQSTVLPPYFVLANLKTGMWSIGLSSAFAQTAPIPWMLKIFDEFYGEDIGTLNST